MLLKQDPTFTEVKTPMFAVKKLGEQPTEHARKIRGMDVTPQTWLTLDQRMTKGWS